MNDPNIIIKAIRESFGGSISVYTMGNCYQFYEILKTIFPDAEAYEASHVWTKINGKFYDIKGELENPENLDLKPITDKNAIISFSKNKWPDETRKERAILMMQENLKKRKE